ncbi:MAG: hypothetical protein N3B13_08670, partial [Deltaproteobacteria bacterium]|nr:hypothetical protein [Deltaproteobacteria bacterium]
MKRLSLLFLTGIFCLSFWLFCCGINTDASTELKINEDRKDTESQAGESIAETVKVAEYKPEKLYKRENWENISEPNVSEWDKVKKLMNEQKYEAAYSELEKLLKRFREAKEYERVTHTLMKMVQLRMSLHGYETAVKFLKSEEWPDGLYSQMVLNLYYAYSLVNYYNAYSWEINQREKVDTGREIDLKKFTKDDIYFEAQKAYLNVFANRDELSNIKVKSFSNYITPNTYPERIRGSLRDAVSYLYTVLLSNTTLWRPEELNEVYALPLDDMIATKKIIVNLGDRDTHPLLKIVYILDDLSEWHRSKGEYEAAFEAYLTKIEYLNSRFSSEEDRKKIRESLENNLKKIEHLEWWTVGMASLADIIMAENRPDSMIRAHKVTMECQKRFSSSIGAKMCLSKQKSIESPSYELSGMFVDTINKKSVLITYKNLTRIYFRAFRLDFFSLLNKSYDYYLYPQYKQLDNIVFGNKPDFEWSEELEETKDFNTHKKYVIQPFRDKGLYLIAASARKNFSKSDNVIKGIYTVVSDMLIETRNDYDGMIKIRVIDGANGSPVQDAEVCLYRYDWQGGHKKHKCYKSDTFGSAKFTESYQSSSYFAVVRKGNDFTTDMQYIYFYHQGTSYSSDRTLVFTDRSVYRPLQKIKWKIVHFNGDYLRGDFKVTPGRTLEVSLYDYN